MSEDQMSHVPAPESPVAASGPESGPVSGRDAQDAREGCEHHWVSTHQPGLPIYWVRQCSLCSTFDGASMTDLFREALDSELAPLVARVAELEAEVERTRRGRGRALLRWKHWWDRAESAEAALARVEALADRWGRTEAVVGMPFYEMAYQDAERELRAALAAAGPAVSDGGCSHGEYAYGGKGRAQCLRCGEYVDDAVSDGPAHRLTEYGTTDCPVEGVRANVDDGECSACGAAVSDGEGATSEACREASWCEDVCAPHGGEWEYEEDGVTVKPECSRAHEHDDPASPVVAPSATDEGGA